MVRRQEDPKPFRKAYVRDKSFGHGVRAVPDESFVASKDRLRDFLAYGYSRKGLEIVREFPMLLEVSSQRACTLLVALLQATSRGRRMLCSMRW